jgi:hypothetical protein
LNTKTNSSESHNKQVAFNVPLFMMVDTKKTEHWWRITRWANHHPGQSVIKEVIATKDMAKLGSMRTSEVETAQVTTATMVTLYTGFPEERIEPECRYFNYLR